MMVKQVIVIRKDLKMTKGKMVAQGSYVSLAIILNMLRGNKNVGDFEHVIHVIKDGKYELTLEVSEGSELDKWLRGSFTKVCLYVSSEKELLGIYNEALENKLPAVIIEDSGLTIFNGIKTKTCVAIGPASSKEIDKITGHLKLL